MTRVYVATTLPRLREALAAGELAATDDVVVAEADDEESEYAALMTAADLSAALLAALPGHQPGRRVVAVAEVAESEVGKALPLRRLVAVHADDEAQDWAAPDADPDADLSWWATQEVETLLAEPD